MAEVIRSGKGMSYSGENIPLFEREFAEYKGRKIGSIGDATCFSFHSLKNMTTGDEGGMLTTNDDALAAEARQLRTMGTLGPKVEKQEKKIGPYALSDPPLADHSGGAFTHDYTAVEEWGTNWRMADVLAAIGRVQLRKLDDLNRRRSAVAARYARAALEIVGFETWRIAPDAKCVFHLYPIFIDRRRIRASQAEVVRFLEDEKGIQIIQRYMPMHLTNYARVLGHRFGECPVAERVFFEEQINLPICPAMTREEVDGVIAALRAAAERFL